MSLILSIFQNCFFFCWELLINFWKLTEAIVDTITLLLIIIKKLFINIAQGLRSKTENKEKDVLMRKRTFQIVSQNPRHGYNIVRSGSVRVFNWWVATVSKIVNEEHSFTFFFINAQILLGSRAHQNQNWWVPCNPSNQCIRSSDCTQQGVDKWGECTHHDERRITQFARGSIKNFPSKI